MYESPSMRGFVGIELGRRIFAEVNGHLERHGLKIGTGTIVDATILHAPSSTDNRSGQRDPDL